MSFPRYPRYKDSGVEWLGEVPEHWAVAPLKAVASHNDDVLDERTPPDFELSYVDISSVAPGIGITTAEQMTFSTAPSRARRRVRGGDVIVSTVRTYLRAISTIPQDAEHLIVSTGFAVIRPREGLLSRFLGYALSAGYFVDQVIARSTGVSYPAINARDLVAIPVVFPPTTEQAAIALFLDSETAKIDALITEQQRLTKLFKEKRQAVISHAVTRGLDPNAPMKPSGVEWLGDVPAHWHVTSLKHAATLIVDCPHETPVYTDDGLYRVIRSADVDRGRIAPTSMRRVSESEYLKRIRRAPLEHDDIVYGREGERWGHAALVPESDLYCLGQRMMQIRPSADSSAHFLMRVLNSDATYRQGEVDTVGATSPHVNVETIRSFALVLPTMEEQESIAAFLDEQVQRFDDTLAVAKRAIALLQERRTALISAAVTGKIDVRGVAEDDAGTRANG